MPSLGKIAGFCNQKTFGDLLSYSNWIGSLFGNIFAAQSLVRITKINPKGCLLLCAAYQIVATIAAGAVTSVPAVGAAGVADAGISA